MDDPTDAGLPRVGQPVVVRDVGVQAYPSRVERVDGGRVVVAMPTALLPARPLTRGEPFEVTWTLPSGVHVLPVEFLAARLGERVRIWELAVTGAAWVEQRRGDVRLPASGTVQLTAGPPPRAGRSQRGTVVPTPPRRFEPLDGQLVDLTGTAVQCAVHAAADDARLADGSRVTCRFTMDGDPVQRPGVIRARRPGVTPDETRVVIVFEQAEPALTARPLARNRA